MGKRYEYTDEQWVAKLLSMRSISDSGCWEFTGGITLGYGYMTWKSKSRRVHRIAASLWLGMDIDSPLLVCHKCDNKKCFNPNHLFLGSSGDNMRDASSKMLLPQAKITPDQVAEIYMRIVNGEPMTRIARDYNVRTTTINSIKSGQSWWHVTRNFPRPSHWNPSIRTATGVPSND